MENPTYYNLGNNSETVQMDYNPAIVSYGELLDVFWQSHRPDYPNEYRQYASIIFYHNEEQKTLALASKAREEARLGTRLYTEIVPYKGFTLAEDYHQKYYLQLNQQLISEYRALYPSFSDFVNSTAVARVNGYFGHNGTCESLKAELDKLELSQVGQQMLIDIVCPAGQNSAEPVCPVPED